MALRVFRCEECGHKMRISGDCCGACSQMKPTWQHPMRLERLVAAAVIGLGAPGQVVLMLGS